VVSKAFNDRFQMKDRQRWPDGPVCRAYSGKEHWHLKGAEGWKSMEWHMQFSIALSESQKNPHGL